MSTIYFFYHLCYGQNMEGKPFVKSLLAIYGLVFIFAVGLMVAMHATPPPALAVFRIPQNLREACPSLAFGWPKSLEVYHVFLLSLFAVIILNAVSLYRLHIPKWRSICQSSSFLGLIIVFLIFLFFKLPFGLKSSCDSTGLQTALIYSSFLFGFFILDLLTLAVSRKKYS